MSNANEIKTWAVSRITAHPSLPVITAADLKVIGTLKRSIENGVEVLPIHITADGVCLVGRLWWLAAQAANVGNVPVLVVNGVESAAMQIAHVLRCDLSHDQLGEFERFKLGLIYYTERSAEAQKNQVKGGKITAGLSDETVNPINARLETAKLLGSGEERVDQARELIPAYERGDAPIGKLWERGIMRLGVAFDIHAAEVPPEKQQLLVDRVLALEDLDDQRAAGRRGAAWRYLEQLPGWTSILASPPIQPAGASKSTPPPPRRSSKKPTLRKQINTLGDEVHAMILTFVKEFPQAQRHLVYAAVVERVEEKYHSHYKAETVAESLEQKKIRRLVGDGVAQPVSSATVTTEKPALPA